MLNRESRWRWSDWLFVVWLGSVWLGLGWLSVARRCQAEVLATEGVKPHIVVFLSDDHSLSDSAVYGSREALTPNMTRLAAAGMTFDRAFVVSPSCAPSRAALMTGLMPARNGAEANHSRPRESIKKLPAYLRELGYEVVAFGKVGHYAQTAELGFDIARHFTYHDDVAVERALEWLRGRESAQPLCLFVGTNWPHVPWPRESQIDDALVSIPVKHIDTPKTREERARYLTAVQTMDRELGQVFDAARAKLGDNTLFIHTSDHGAQWPLAKWNLYDDGIRTPLIVAWPGKIAAKTRSRALVSWVDLLPTLIDAAGGQPDPALDGRSLLPLLRGETETHREAIYTVHSSDGNFNVYPMRSVRTERWKYIRNCHPEFRHQTHISKVLGPESYWPSWLAAAKTNPLAADKVKRIYERPAEELYDLASDPLEQHNLATDPAAASPLASLRLQLNQWLQSQGDTQTIFGMPELLPTTGRAPNIISIFIDDMGWADLGCFEGKLAKTPNIDRLASEGLRFRQHYVNSPICSPSRTALTTGQYPARHRITSFLAERKANEARGMAQWLDVSAPTLARMLQQTGYRTGHFGKWHLGGQRNVGEAPLITEYGFDASLTNFEGLGPRVLPLKDAYDGRPAEPHALGSDSLGRGPIEWLDRSQITTRYVAKAIEFIEQAQQDGKPFFVNVWPDDVHSPFFPPQGRRGDGTKQTLYSRVLESLDEQLAPLFERIRNNPKLRDNTLIVLASDNGPEPGAGSAGHLRGSKGQLWEGGIRSPLIVWGPGLVKPEVVGSINRTTVISSMDVMVSLSVLGGATPPSDYEPDGENLLAAMLGVSKANRSKPLFWRRPPDRPGSRENPLPDLAVRDGEWKLVCDIEGKQAQLFHLEDDESEQHDRAAQHGPLVKRLRKAVLDWNASLPRDAITAPVR